MGFFDALFGQRRPPAARRDDLFRLSTAAADIEDKLGVQYGGHVGVLLRPLEAVKFSKLEEDVNQTLALGGADIKAESRLVTDDLGYHWVILQADALDSALAAVRLTETLLEDGGFTDALTAAAVDFGDVVILYSYRHGRFYPFCQTGHQRRDNAREIRVAAQLEPLLPTEKDPSLWYPVWDPPWKGSA